MSASAGVAGQPVEAARLRGRMTRGNGAVWLLAIPAGLMAILLVVPTLMTVRTAVQNIGWGGFVDVASDPLFLRAVARTLLVAAVVTAVSLPCALIYALAMTMAARHVRRALFAVLLLTMWISLLARTYGWVLTLQPKGALEAVLHLVGFSGARVDLLGSTAAIYPAMIHVLLPFMVLPIYASALSLDERQIRAAASLGGSSRRILFRVVVPQLRDGMVSGGILVFILALGFFVTPALLGGPSDLMIATLIDLKYQFSFSFGDAAGIASILLVGVLGLYVVADRLLKVSARWGAQL